MKSFLTQQITMLLIFMFCNLFVNFAYSQNLSFDGDITYKKNQQEHFSELKSGQTLTLSSGDYILVQTKDNLPVLILAAKSEKTNIKITNADISQNYIKKLTEQVNTSVSEIIETIRKSESLMQKREYTQALNLLNPIREKHSKNSEVLFLSGTLNYLLNNNKIAQDELEKGLSLDPKNASALKLLENIKGKSR